MAKRKRATRKRNPSNTLAKAINDVVDARLSKALEKQNPHLQKTLAGMEKVLARIEKKLSKTSKVRPVKTRKARKAKKKSKSKKCSVRGCKRPARARGLCNSHYVSAIRKGTIKTKKRKKKK